MAEDSKGAEPVDIHVGAMMRRRRRNLGMGQDEVAAALNVTPQQVQRYETAASRISASKLFMASRALKTPVAYFFSDLDEPEFELFSREIQENITAFLKSNDGQELAAIFPQIGDAAVRKQFIGLARAMAKASPAGKLVKN